MVPAEKARLVFMGSDAIALPLLKFLAEQGTRWVEPVGVLTQPDRPAGRGRKLAPNAIKSWALDQGWPVWQPEKPGEAEEARFRGLGVDCFLVMAYGHLLRKSLLTLPARGTYNLHTSLLPAYRGASPIQGALASGETVTGVTLMGMVPKMDAGPIIDQEKVAVGRTETAPELEARMAQACVPLLQRNLPGMAAGKVAKREQDHEAATYTRKLQKTDAELDFLQPASVLARRINALQPWPGARFSRGDAVIRVGRADWEPGMAPGSPGTILGLREGALCVASGDGVLRLLELQRPGGRMLPADDFLRGLSIAPGEAVESGSMPPLVSEVPFPPAQRR